jgi:hypothetical protein
MYYCYRRADGQYAGSGISEIQTDAHGSTPIHAVLSDDEDAPLPYWDGSAWGTTPTEHAPPTPQVVTPLQGLRAIAHFGLAETYTAWVATLDPITDFEALAFVSRADVWRYDDPLLNAALVLFGVADQKDALFRYAVTQ